MRTITSIALLLILLTSAASAQEIIKAKYAGNYVGKIVTVVGIIKYKVGPGLHSYMSFYLVTDSTEPRDYVEIPLKDNTDSGVDVTVPIDVWKQSKSITDSKEGMTMKATGLIVSRLGEYLYIYIQNLADVEILK